MGNVTSTLLTTATAVLHLVSAAQSKTAGSNPTLDVIEGFNRVLTAQGFKLKANKNKQKVGLNSCQAQSDSTRQATLSEAELASRKDDDACFPSLKESADDHKAQILKHLIHEETEKAIRRVREAAQEHIRHMRNAQQAAGKAARVAEDKDRLAGEQKMDIEGQLSEVVQPVVTPPTAEIAETKRKYQYQEGVYHFAVAGVAGSGKSSLINALLGLKNRDRGAAAAGVTETTQSVNRYPDPKYPFVWYDIPGAGTLKIPDWQYFNSQGLYVFDALIVLIDNRFTATDDAILRNACRYNIPCFIVRSKSDSNIRHLIRDLGFYSEDEDLDSKKRTEFANAAREKLIGKTKRSVSETLKHANLPEQRVYLVSSSALLSVVTRTVTPKVQERIIDEINLLHDLLEAALRRRGG